MKVIKTISKEFLGEENVRLFVEFESEQEGVRLRIANGRELETIELDGSEMIHITGVVGRCVENGGRSGSVHLEGPDEMMFSVYGDNMGEPYRRGVSLRLSSADVHAGVFLEIREAASFLNFLEANAPSPRSIPSPL